MNLTYTEKQKWEQYCAEETARAVPILTKYGFSFDATQPHTTGERYLARPIGGAKKLLLLGKKNSDGTRVAIKISSNKNGIAEIQHERTCRETLNNMAFAHNIFHSPRELFFVKENNMAIMISEFVEQECSFTDRPISEQFTLALSILKVQEQAHATTYGHTRLVRRTFGEMYTDDYLQKCRSQVSAISATMPDNEALRSTLDHALYFLTKNVQTIEQYRGFLTNWDFTPQNIRISKDFIYFLDHASFHFGNKHESWARFINFMSLYEPQVAEALVLYVRDNRTPEESLSLKLMRVYRLTELIRFYTEWLTRTEGNTKKLALARIDFWHTVLKATLDDAFVPREVIDTYKKTRDTLRSEDEKQRQIGLH